MKHYLLVSHCQGKSYRSSRRIASSFLNRVAEKTWEGKLSQEGLSILVGALKAKASRHNCIVIYEVTPYGKRKVIHIGNSRHYTNDGEFAFSQSTIAIRPEINESAIMRLMAKMAEMAGYLHDLGKATEWFQKKLQMAIEKNIGLADPVRHEVISTLLSRKVLEIISQASAPQDIGKMCQLQLSFITDAFLIKHTQRTQHECAKSISRLLNQQLSRSPDSLIDAVSLGIEWLVLSHHRLPEGPQKFSERKPSISYTGKFGGNYFIKVPAPDESISDEDKNGKEYGFKDKTFDLNLTLCDKGQPYMDSAWQKAVLDCFQRIKKLSEKCSLENLNFNNQAYAAALSFMGRPSVVYADYMISSEKKPSGKVKRDGIIYANTIGHEEDAQFADTLVIHLLGVGARANQYFSELFLRKDGLLNNLPSLDVQERMVMLPGLQSRTQDARYKWQDVLRDKLAPHRSHAPFFASVMGKTGAGKTRGNMMLMHALCEKMRFSCAIGLRSLVKQTYGAYQEPFIGLRKEQVALLIGEAGAIQETDHQAPDGTGNSLEADSQTLMGDYLIDGVQLFDHELGNLFDKGKQRALLCNPIQVMTVDHIMPGASLSRSVELKLLMHLMSTDIILDEIDDYSIESQVALSRMAFIAGLFGRRFVISSATATPIIQEAFFEGWQSGINLHQELFVYKENKLKPFAVLASHVEGNEVITCEIERFRNYCDGFIKNVSLEARTQARHRLEVASIPRKDSKTASLGQITGLYSNPRRLNAQQHEAIVDVIHRAHDYHGVEHDGIKVSSGFVRFNNVSNAQHLAMALNQRIDDAELLVFCYHSQMTFWERKSIEDVLLSVNNRKSKGGIDGDKVIFEHPLIKEATKRAKQAGKNDVILVLCTTNIIEVGRDHDYDWAILEPSSTRSLVQSCGRVWRHRMKALGGYPNVWVLSSNVKSLCGLEDGKPKMKQPISTWSMHGIEDDEWVVEDQRKPVIRLQEPVTELSKKSLEGLGLKLESKPLMRGMPQTYKALVDYVNLYEDLIKSPVVHSGLCLEIPSSVKCSFMTSLELAQQYLHLHGVDNEHFRFDKPSALEYGNDTFDWLTSHHADRRKLREGGGRFHLTYSTSFAGTDSYGQPCGDWILQDAKESRSVKFQYSQLLIGNVWMPPALEAFMEENGMNSYRSCFVALRKDQAEGSLEGKYKYIRGIGLVKNT